MPFTQDQIQIKGVELHLLRYVDFDPFTYLDQLTEIEKDRFFTFRHISRKREFVATRILRHRIFGFQHIHYDTNGAPYINGEGYISISHADSIVGIALCRDFKIGLDLETIREKAAYLSSKFLSDEEKTMFDQSNTIEMTKVWSAKEVLYKLAGRKEILFKSQLLLSKIDNENYEGTVVNPDHHLKMNVHSSIWNHTVISVNTSACEKI
jgi:4'-phosphopantetheinyl transferase